MKFKETIVIYRKEQEVYALDKSTGKKAVAKCSPKDEFDFRTGAKLAFKRLMLKARVPFRAGLTIWCNTEEEYDQLMHQLDARGYKWFGGNSLKEYKVWDLGASGIRIFIQNYYHDHEITWSGGGKQYRSKASTAWDPFDYVDFPQVEFGDILYNGKVVCIDATCNTDFYTVGKIYEFKDGYMTADDGETCPGKPVHSFNEWQKWTSAKFVEIVE